MNADDTFSSSSKTVVLCYQEYMSRIHVSHFQVPWFPQCFRKYSFSTIPSAWCFAIFLFLLHSLQFWWFFIPFVSGITSETGAGADAFKTFFRDTFRCVIIQGLYGYHVCMHGVICQDIKKCKRKSGYATETAMSGNEVLILAWLFLSAPLTLTEVGGTTFFFSESWCMP